MELSTQFDRVYTKSNFKQKLLKFYTSKLNTAVWDIGIKQKKTKNKKQMSAQIS